MQRSKQRQDTWLVIPNFIAPAIGRFLYLFFATTRRSLLPSIVCLNLFIYLNCIVDADCPGISQRSYWVMSEPRVRVTEREGGRHVSRDPLPPPPLDSWWQKPTAPGWRWMAARIRTPPRPSLGAARPARAQHNPRQRPPATAGAGRVTSDGPRSTSCCRDPFPLTCGARWFLDPRVGGWVRGGGRWRDVRRRPQQGPCRACALAQTGRRPRFLPSGFVWSSRLLL